MSRRKREVEPAREEVSDGGQRYTREDEPEPRKRHSPLKSPKVDAFARYRAEGYSEYDALEKAGLPRRKGLLRGLQGNHKVQTAIIHRARKGANIVHTVDTAYGKLDDLISDPGTDPMVLLRAIDVLFKSLSNSGVLTMKEKAAIEQNPESRSQIALMVLSAFKEVAVGPVLDAIAVEVTLEPGPGEEPTTY